MIGLPDRLVTWNPREYSTPFTAAAPPASGAVAVCAVAAGWVGVSALAVAASDANPHSAVAASTTPAVLVAMLMTVFSFERVGASGFSGVRGVSVRHR